MTKVYPNAEAAAIRHLVRIGDLWTVIGAYSDWIVDRFVSNGQKSVRSGFVGNTADNRFSMFLALDDFWFFGCLKAGVKLAIR